MTMSRIPGSNATIPVEVTGSKVSEIEDKALLHAAEAFGCTPDDLAIEPYEFTRIGLSLKATIRVRLASRS
jgi:hypothetical protein